MHTGRSRCDQVGHGLRLRKIHAAIEEGASGELARCSGACPGVDEPLEEALLDEGRAVARQLYGVLTGERMRGTEDGSHSLVEQFAIADKTAEGDRMRATLGERYARARLEKTVAKRDRLRSGDAHDGQRATSRRRGQGADGGGVSGHRLCFWGVLVEELVEIGVRPSLFVQSASFSVFICILTGDLFFSVFT